MKKLTLILILGIILLASVIASVTFSRDISIDKTLRDFLLTKIPDNLDEKGNPIKKEINMSIIIKCGETECLWSAEYPNIISTYDNKLSKERLTDEQVKNKVIQLIKQRLEDYATSEINKKDYLDVTEGVVIIIEK